MFNENIILDIPQKEQDIFYVALLQKKLTDLFDNQHVTAIDRQRFWNQIFDQHQDASRAYHNLSHLYSIHAVASLYPDFPEDNDLFYWILFFHDLIYNAHKQNNEVESAKMAAAFLSPYLSSEQIDYIVSVIHSTAKHQPLDDQLTTRIFLDSDLAILAAPLKVYQRYAKAIRKEYRIFPDLLYKPGRRKVLRHFLERPRIYFTEWFFMHGEEQARKNLEWEVKQLK